MIMRVRNIGDVRDVVFQKGLYIVPCERLHSGVDVHVTEHQLVLDVARNVPHQDIIRSVIGALSRNGYVRILKKEPQRS